MPGCQSPEIGRALEIGGWMSTGELTWLGTQATSRKLIVEFGSLHGRSTRALADNMPSDGKLWAVDPWNGDYICEKGSRLPFTTYVFPYFKRNLMDHIEAGRVIPVRGFSQTFKLPHKVDMVFIDGDHTHKAVLKDIQKAYDLLNDGGLICGHDYGHPEWPAVKELVDSMIPSVQVEETIWWAIKS